MPNANFVICPGLHPAFVPSLSVALYPPTLPTLTTTCDNIDHSEPVGVIATMTTNAYSEIYAVNCTPHNTARGFFPVPGDEWAPPARAGPWGWQWRNDMHEIVSIPSSSVPISIKALFDSIEKIVPGMYRTVTDLAYSRSPECPFIVNEPAMANFRSQLDKYEDKKAMLPRDAQAGVKKSIAAALGEKRPAPEGKIHAVACPYPVDAGCIADGIRGWN